MLVMVVEYHIGAMVFMVVVWNVVLCVMIRKGYLKLCKKPYKDIYIYTI